MKIGIHNVELGENVIRDMTTEELAQYEAEQAIIKANKDALVAEQLAKAAAKAELLDRLGITEDEAKLLLG